jgi:hypothetical protein
MQRSSIASVFIVKTVTGTLPRGSRAAHLAHHFSDHRHHRADRVLHAPRLGRSRAAKGYPESAPFLRCCPRPLAKGRTNRFDLSGPVLSSTGISSRTIARLAALGPPLRVARRSRESSIVFSAPDHGRPDPLSSNRRWKPRLAFRHSSCRSRGGVTAGGKRSYPNQMRALLIRRLVTSRLVP